VAFYYLSVSASSIPVESMFSITGLILNNKHSSLSPVKRNYLSFFHDKCGEVGFKPTSLCGWLDPNASKGFKPTSLIAVIFNKA